MKTSSACKWKGLQEVKEPLPGSCQWHGWRQTCWPWQWARQASPRKWGCRCKQSFQTSSTQWRQLGNSRWPQWCMQPQLLSTWALWMASRAWMEWLLGSPTLHCAQHRRRPQFPEHWGSWRRFLLWTWLHTRTQHLPAHPCGWKLPMRW